MTAEVINLFEKPKTELWCSFCKRKESQVKKMVSNSGGGNNLRCICSECISLAHKRMNQEQNQDK